MHSLPQVSGDCAMLNGDSNIDCSNLSSESVRGPSFVTGSGFQVCDRFDSSLQCTNSGTRRNAVLALCSMPYYAMTIGVAAVFCTFLYKYWRLS